MICTRRCFEVLLWLLLAIPLCTAADNLKLNPRLDYSSDSQDGPLITGDSMQAGLSAAKPNYVIIYGEGCFNSKRQARRTVDLYSKYRDGVGFVVVDLDEKLTPVQQELVSKYYRGFIPHVVVTDRDGKPLYNSSGEIDSSVIEKILDQTLSK
ncbi:MAG TPA: hypothetical protein VFA89_09825 [Terriglobales bacterium]|nr:hypothetical protein [Terriglobales bacterium]